MTETQDRESGTAEPSLSLGRRVLAGVGWTFVSAVCVRLLQFLVTVALARLLLPGEFGLFALGTIVIAAITLLRDLGFGQALIYYKSEVQKDAETTFAMSGLFGLASWLAIYAASPVIADVFRNHALIWPLRVMSCSVAISSLGVVPSVLMEKELEFRKRAMPEFAMGLSYAAVSILLALHHMGVWSLVAGHIASAAAFVAVAWAVSGWRPALSFHVESARRILGYGRPLIAASILLFAFFYIDNAAIGRWLGVTALGYYALAFNVCNIPATNITHVVNRVMYPTYSKLNDDIPAVKEAYLRTIKSIAMLSFPIGLWICLFSEDFVGAFFGHRWLPAAPLFRVLAFYGIARSIGSTAGSVFMATGQPKWLFRLGALQLALVLPFVYPVVAHYGAYGIAVLFTAAYIINNSLWLLKVAGILGVTMRELAAALRYPLTATAAAVGASAAVVRLALPHGPAAAVGSAVFALTAYPLLVLVLDEDTRRLARFVLRPTPGQVYDGLSPGKGSTEWPAADR